MDHHQHGHIEHLLMSGNVFDVATFVAIVWFSFLMSWHCGIMCGPLICSRLISSKRSNWLDVVLYNFGRMLSYTLAGAAIGSFVHGLNASFGNLIPEFGKALAMLLALVLAIQGSMMVFDCSLPRIISFPASMSKIFLKNIAHVDFLKNAKLRSFALGLFTVFLPCMTLFSAFTAAAASGQLIAGAFILLGFGLGTLPVMIVVPLLSERLGRNSLLPKNPKFIRIGGGLILMATSIITVLRIYH